MKPAVTFPDIERLVVDYLEANLDDGDTTVGIDLPDGWTTGSPNHLQVRSDGTPTIQWPVMARATVRLVAWSASATEAKALTSRGQGVLCAHPGAGGLVNVTALTGALPGFDEDHQAELASTTCRAVLRSQPIT